MPEEAGHVGDNQKTRSLIVRGTGFRLYFKSSMNPLRNLKQGKY